MISSRQKKITNKRRQRLLKYILILTVFLGLIFLIKYLSAVKIPIYLDLKKSLILSPLGKDDIKQLQNILTQYNLEAVSIRRLPDSYEIALNSGPVVIFSSSDFEAQAASLQLILNRFKIEGRRIKFIDLRFSKPVVK